MNSSKKSFIIAGSIIGTLFASNSAYASTYHVKSGDSLYKIAKANHTTVQKLKSQNKLSNNLIFPGQVLKINESTVKSTTSTKKHVVKLGDTLSGIAKKYNLSLNALLKLNPTISNSDRIRIGQSIIVSGKATSTSATAAKSSSTSTYKVKSGDSLSKIASKNKTTVKALLALNPSIKNANTLRIGQSIKLSGKATTSSATSTANKSGSTYKVKSGDSLSKIASKNKTTVKAILSLNPSIKNANTLRIGQTIKLSGKATTAATKTVSSASSEVDRVLNAAKKYLGAKYQYAASTSRTDAFDCSSFTMKAFQAAGISLPRTSTGQAQMGVPVSSYSLKKGDLVFYDTNHDGVINHVGIYAGNNQMINASTSKGVSYANINGSYWKPLFVKAVRILN
ncbi:LysM peptidoglycan-binding domain-containing protein [Peribacillus sp. NPDC097284]|uniref:C40 family peptidase n=1 Tax=Peribacillus sp. NPDC097284 TaxID=3364401 RepID=UPI0038243C49